MAPFEAGLRIDAFLATWSEALSRAAAGRLVRDGRVTQNGLPCKPATRLKAGDLVQAVFPPPARVLPPQPIEFEVIYEDGDLIFLDKPAGLAVHPGAGRADGTLVNGLLHRFPELAAVGGSSRPGIVHRLDLDTTGVMVVARNGASYQHLIKRFERREVKKTYLALVRGRAVHAEGAIEAPLRRSSSDPRRVRVDWSGREALTRFRVVAAGEDATLLELDLHTGRTHQARVHLAAVGHPIIGDLLYALRRTKRSIQTARLMLQSTDLTFTDPTTGEQKSFHLNPDPTFQHLLSSFS